MIRRLARALRRALYRGRHTAAYLSGRTRAQSGAISVLLLPRTPRPPPASPGPWRPRTAPYVRLALPLPDDTVTDLPRASLALLLARY